MAERNSDSQVNLHGDLYVKIIKGWSMHSAFNIPPAPIVTVRLRKLNLACMRIVFCSETEMPPSPLWVQPFQIPLAHQLPNSDSIHFNLEYKNIMVGTAFVPIQRILTGETILEWFPILDNGYEAGSQSGVAILIEMTFNNCEYSPLYRYGIASDPENFGLQNSYFPVLKSGSVTLYQDAHVPDGMLPAEIVLDGGKVFEQKKCWVDICNAILEAKQMVYIVGWSIYHKVELVREQTRRPLPNGVADYNLGDLLKYKAQNGVPVLVIVWNNPSGKITTHTEETRKFFENSSVSCVLAPRPVINELKNSHYPLTEIEIVDSAIQNTEGVKGPRQPWHDLHCKLEGPAAYFMLIHFEQLWNNFAQWSNFGQGYRMALIHATMRFLDVPLLNHAQSIPNDDPTFWIYKEDDPENWHIQNLIIEKSIQSAYNQAIRSAQHFIYIENQFFIGSSYAWPSHRDAGANNLIPMELALKIASKIKANERFAVYIVIPMQPEGHHFTSEILFWQGQTMQMMYDIIAQELKSMDIENSHPEDYLNFYCLGNREELPKEVSVPPDQSSQNVSVSNSEQPIQKFMVYVHSKGMIVDDEYVILGSANINERSMAGSRDTEIAMGAYQPHHTWGKRKSHPYGQIYGYRMSLWAEHLGTLHDCFKEPKDLDCVKSVNKIAVDNLSKYKAKDFTPLQGHLLKFPIQVNANGKIEVLPGKVRYFSDDDQGNNYFNYFKEVTYALTT
ncbi:hypothetical protein ACB092_07G160000 [Castanea dentata]